MLMIKDWTIAILLGLSSIILSFFITNHFPELPIVSDSEDYHTIAVNVLEKGLYPSIPNQTLLIYPPLYPLFVAGVYAITHIGSYVAVYALQYIVVGVLSAIVFLLLRKFSRTPRLVSLITAATVLFWPYFVMYSQLISSEVLYTCLLLLFFYFFIAIEKQSPWSLVVLAGITLGLTILTRPVALLLLPWMMIGLLILSRMPKILGIENIPWKKYIAVLIISVATLLPWEIYISKTYDQLIPVASNLGNVFTKANKTFEYLPEGEKPSILKAKAKNVYLFWDPGASGYHLDIVKEKYPIAGIAVSLYKVVFFLIIIMAGVSAVLYRKERLVLYSLLVITYTWALHTALFPFPRYTLPIMPFVIIVAVLGITHGLKTYAKNPHSHSGA